MSCYECKYYREDEDGCPYCGKTNYWLGLKDRSGYCAFVESS